MNQNVNNMEPYAAGVVVIRHGLILSVVRRNGCLGLPAGKIEAGETAEQAAYRECVEETGLEPIIISSSRFPPFKRITKNDHLCYIFRAEVARINPLRAMDPNEVIPVWADPISLIDRGAYPGFNCSCLKHFGVII